MTSFLDLSNLYKIGNNYINLYPFIKLYIIIERMFVLLDRGVCVLKANIPKELEELIDEKIYLDLEIHILNTQLNKLIKTRIKIASYILKKDWKRNIRN